MPFSPLDGIPFAVKANIAIRMTPWHAGIAALSSRMAIVDSAAVSTMRAAGMIPVGITNMHEAALGVTTDNWAFGRTLNPHDPRHFPGGSFGGSAAAVAAGMMPIALGTDDMGSVRLPSALCGVIGYKPPAGAIPVDGIIPLSPRLDHIGIHARSMADVKATMRLFSPNVDDKATLPPFRFWRTGMGLELEPRIFAAHNRLLDSLDCDDPIDWKWVDLSALRRAGLLVCERDAEHTFEDALKNCRHGFSKEFRSLIDWAEKVPAHKFARAEDLIDGAGERLRRDLRNAVQLCPTTPVSAPRVGDPVPHQMPDLTAPACFAGVPSISVPMPNADPGMPIGLQITGLRESDVLHAAEMLCPEVIRPVMA